MILATIIICAAMAVDKCSPLTGYRAVPIIDQAYPSLSACQIDALIRIVPALDHHPGDTFRVVCSGKFVTVGKEA